MCLSHSCPHKQTSTPMSETQKKNDASPLRPVHPSPQWETPSHATRGIVDSPQSDQGLVHSAKEQGRRLQATNNALQREKMFSHGLKLPSELQ